MKLENYTETKKLGILEYGESGCGKSIRSALAAKWGPVYIFDLDGKIGGIHEFYKNHPELLSAKDLSNIEYDSYRDCDAVYSKLREIDRITTETGKCPYVTIIFDSWTAWEDIVLAKIIQDNPGKDRKKMRTGPDLKHVILVPTLEDYGIHATVQTRLLLELTGLPTNLILVAHIQSRKDEVSGGREIGIQAVGKLWKLMPKYFSEVHRCFVDRGAYKVQVRADALYACNTRLQNIPKNGEISSDLSVFNDMAMKTESVAGTSLTSFESKVAALT